VGRATLFREGAPPKKACQLIYGSVPARGLAHQAAIFPRGQLPQEGLQTFQRATVRAAFHAALSQIRRKGWLAVRRLGAMK